MLLNKLLTPWSKYFYTPDFISFVCQFLSYVLQTFFFFFDPVSVPVIDYSVLAYPSLSPSAESCDAPGVWGHFHALAKYRRTHMVPFHHIMSQWICILFQKVQASQMACEWHLKRSSVSTSNAELFFHARCLQTNRWHVANCMRKCLFPHTQSAPPRLLGVTWE